MLIKRNIIINRLRACGYLQINLRNNKEKFKQRKLKQRKLKQRKLKHTHHRLLIVLRNYLPHLPAKNVYNIKYRNVFV